MHHLKGLGQKRYIDWTLRAILGGFFLAVGVSKLMDPAGFAIQIENYGLLPDAWLDPVSILLPLLEIIVGGATLLGFRLGILALGAMLLGFSILLGWALWEGLDIPCGCFSTDDVAEAHGLWWALGRDLAMLIGVGWLLRKKHKGETDA